MDSTKKTSLESRSAKRANPSKSRPSLGTSRLILATSKRMLVDVQIHPSDWDRSSLFGSSPPTSFRRPIQITASSVSSSIPCAPKHPTDHLNTNRSSGASIHSTENNNRSSGANGYFTTSQGSMKKRPISTQSSVFKRPLASLRSTAASESVTAGFKLSHSSVSCQTTRPFNHSDYSNNTIQFVDSVFAPTSRKVVDSLPVRTPLQTIDPAYLPITRTSQQTIEPAYLPITRTPLQTIDLACVPICQTKQQTLESSWVPISRTSQQTLEPLSVPISRTKQQCAESIFAPTSRTSQQRAESIFAPASRIPEIFEREIRQSSSSRLRPGAPDAEMMRNGGRFTTFTFSEDFLQTENKAPPVFHGQPSSYSQNELIALSRPPLVTRPTPKGVAVARDASVSACSEDGTSSVSSYSTLPSIISSPDFSHVKRLIPGKKSVDPVWVMQQDRPFSAHVFGPFKSR